MEMLRQEIQNRQSSYFSSAGEVKGRYYLLVSRLAIEEIHSLSALCDMDLDPLFLKKAKRGRRHLHHTHIARSR